MNQLGKCAAECQMFAYCDRYLPPGPQGFPCIGGYPADSKGIGIGNEHADNEVIAEESRTVDPVGILLAMETLGVCSCFLASDVLLGYVLDPNLNIVAYLGDELPSQIAGAEGRDSQFQEYILGA